MHYWSTLWMRSPRVQRDSCNSNSYRIRHVHRPLLGLGHKQDSLEFWWWLGLLEGSDPRVGTFQVRARSFPCGLCLCYGETRGELVRSRGALWSSLLGKPRLLEEMGSQPGSGDSSCISSANLLSPTRSCLVCSGHFMFYMKQLWLPVGMCKITIREYSPLIKLVKPVRWGDQWNKTLNMQNLAKKKE